MPFQPVLDTAEIVHRWIANGELCTMTFYGRKEGGYDQADIDELANQMDGWANDAFKATLSNQVTYDGVNVRGLATLNDLEAFNNDSLGVGGVAAAPMPNNVTKAYKRRSAFTGRSARGRVYYPLTTASIDSSDENRMSTGATTAQLTALNSIDIYIAAATFTEVIVSRYTAGALRTVGVTFDVVGYSSTSTLVNTQRRRMPRT